MKERELSVGMIYWYVSTAQWIPRRLCKLLGPSRMNGYSRIEILDTKEILYVSSGNLEEAEPRDIVRWKISQPVI